MLHAGRPALSINTSRGSSRIKVAPISQFGGNWVGTSGHRQHTAQFFIPTHLTFQGMHEKVQLSLDHQRFELVRPYILDRHILEWSYFVNVTCSRVPRFHHERVLWKCLGGFLKHHISLLDSEP